MKPLEVTRRLAAALDNETTIQDAVDGIRDFVACVLASGNLDPVVFAAAVVRRTNEFKAAASPMAPILKGSDHEN